MSAALLALLLAAAPAPGQASAPGEEIALAPAAVRPGDVVLVRVRAPAGAPVAGALAGRPLQFWERGDERWALGALPLETLPGPLPVTVEVAGRSAAPRLEVVEHRFPAKSLRVAPGFVSPPASVEKRIEGDRAAFARAFEQPFDAPLFTGSFAWPNPGAHDRGRFGDQRTFNGRKESVHYGLDFDAPRGAPVRAANDGAVVLARDCYLSGRTVILWHGADLFTVYFHMDRLEVRPGAKVRRGDRLGRVGSTGRSTGPHLHWGVKVGTLYVDPESLMGIDFATGAASPRRPAPPPAREEPPAATPEDAASTAVSGAPRR